jgi:hypothetical protein
MKSAPSDPMLQMLNLYAGDIRLLSDALRSLATACEPRDNALSRFVVDICDDLDRITEMMRA